MKECRRYREIMSEDEISEYQREKSLIENGPSEELFCRFHVARTSDTTLWDSARNDDVIGRKNKTRGNTVIEEEVCDIPDKICKKLLSERGFR